MGSLCRPQLKHPEEGSALFQAWGWGVSKELESTVLSFIHACIQERLPSACRALESRCEQDRISPLKKRLFLVSRTENNPQ